MSIAREVDDKKLYFQGYGVEPIVYIARKVEHESYFGGAACVIESRMKLETATKIQGATEINHFDRPGCGELVTLTDPVGHHVHLIENKQDRK